MSSREIASAEGKGLLTEIPSSRLSPTLPSGVDTLGGGNSNGTLSSQYSIPKIDLSMVSHDEDEDEEERVEVSRSEKISLLREMFHEKCSMLYHDIHDALRGDADIDSSSEASTPRLLVSTEESDIWRRHRRLMDQAALLVDALPEMGDDVRYRMQLVQSGLTQLETALARRTESCTSSGDEHVSAGGSLNKLRKWLQEKEGRLNSASLQNVTRVPLSRLHHLLADSKVLQREIERDGGALVYCVQKQLKSSSGGGIHRKQVVLSTLERRWHGLWIRSLEWQCRIEEQIQAIKLGLESGEESEGEQGEPSAKRRRVNFSTEKAVSGQKSREEEDQRSQASDTIPFAREEYQSIGMEVAGRGDGNGNSVSEEASTDSDVEYRNEKGEVVANRSSMIGDGSGITQLKEEGGWETGRVEIIHQDVGYSSGENSIHEGVPDTVAVFEPSASEDRKLKRIYKSTIPRSESDQMNNNNRANSPSEDQVVPKIGEKDNKEEEKHKIDSSPLKSYYKMTPLDDAGATDTETPRGISEDKETIVEGMDSTLDGGCQGYGEDMADSMVVHLDSEISGQNDLQEVLSLLDDEDEEEGRRVAQFVAGNQAELSMDGSMFGVELEQFIDNGTTWKPFVSGRTRQLLEKKLENKGRIPAEGEEIDRDSCDASGELSETEDVDAASEFQTQLSILPSPPNLLSPIGGVPPNSPQDYLLTSTPQGSLKRQRRRPRSERPLSLTSGLRFPFSIPNSTSDGAIMNLSMTSSAYSTFEYKPQQTNSMINSMTTDPSMDQSVLMTQSLCSTLTKGARGFFEDLNSSLRRRKKLRARRMPRSMSDGEHLSFYNMNANKEQTDSSSKNVGSQNEPRPPSLSPLLDQTSPQLETSTTIEDVELPEIGSEKEEKKEEREDCGESYDGMGAGEGLVDRLEGDGGSVASETAEHSEVSIWEWDDYKPPNHNEHGPPDQKLDDSYITAFGDDYRLFLGGGALTALSTSPPLSGRSSQPGAPPMVSLGARLPPIGLSSPDSDSEMEDLHSVVKESQKQLRLAQAALRRIPEASSMGKNGHTLAELLATCETNVRCLQAITGHMLSLGGKSGYKQQDYGAVTTLLKDWQDLLFNARSIAAKHNTLSTNQRPGSPDPSNSLLHCEIQRLAATLQELINTGSLNRSFTTGCYQSLAEVEESLELLQNLHSRLQEERHRLRLLARSFQSCSGTDPDVKAELQQLYRCCDKALVTCAHQLSELGHLKQSWQDWDLTLETLKCLLSSLDNKMSELEFHRSHPGKISTLGTPIRPNLKAIHSDMQVCQDRLKKLESVCAFLNQSCQRPSSEANKPGDDSMDTSDPTTDSDICPPDFKSEIDSIDQSLQSLFHRFKQLPEGLEICINSQKQAEKSLRRRTVKSLVTHQLAEEVVPPSQDSVTENPTMKRKAKRKARSLLKSVWGAFRSSWPVQICLLLLLCLGAMVLQPLCCKGANNWRYAWGPQLDYVRGPPPS